ncbi:DNA-directed RNA polymerase subunit beta [Caedimonas varicaedens]|uniref:DNA-directed RNA polymerase subunit beta n=1 Tax=Caedimonas varicaedens TaxID=1629334 RepID=A0A0K8MCP6_9PROT|nr:DNA-directed RNA polymerase subunit beta [Caedimonas varicaedens]
MPLLPGRKRIRKSFERLSGVAPMPNLIELQKGSYEAFLQRTVSFDKREMVGLQAVLKSFFPIKDFSERSQLEFYRYDFEMPKYDVEECQQRDSTYAAPLKVTFRLVVWDEDQETKARSIRDIKEQEVYMGDIPLMTDNGTFIINGVERVIVSQMHRSPGVFFDHDRGKTHSSGKLLFSGRIIPYRGSWLDFEFDAKDLLYVRIDRRRKLPVTTLLMSLSDDMKPAHTREGAENQSSLGMTREQILAEFYDCVAFIKTKKGWKIPFDVTRWRSGKLQRDLIDAKTGKVFLEEGEKMTPRLVKKLKDDGITEILVPFDDLLGRFVSEDMINESTGEIYVEAGDEITEDILKILEQADFERIPTLAIDHIHTGPYLRNTLMADRNYSREEALLDIYRVMRPGEPPTIESAESLFYSLFFDLERYDLSAVGRVKMNSRLEIQTEDNVRILRKEDIIAIVKVLLELKDGRGEIDDIDNLGNRRVRPVGELLENQFRMGLSRMERAIRERMSSVDIDTCMPHDLINAKPVSGAVKEFFASSQLSQFMDQTNALAEITHKRRLSALGPGGLTRERAGFEVRDVHPTHYGRMCPIETPEGPNIGLINSLATYARVNKYGFIESPYRRVVKAKVTDEIVYLSATEESRYAIAQASAGMDSKGYLNEDFVSCRKEGEFTIAPPSDIDFIDVSPKQLVSVAASLIPFLENDDANRALMGSNMQRQAVPLLQAEAPLIGTGMEKSVASDSGVTVIAKRDGIVDQADAMRIVIRVTDDFAKTGSVVDIYNLRKFQRSNHSTCINQKPLVFPGESVKAGDIIADGPATDCGELALGQNVLVAFMPWHGYNFEDSIILSERLVREDTFTSIHIEEFETSARDTKLGQEEITRDIPNVSDEALRHLDEAGIGRIGAEVKPGDILVGKVTPKGETPMTPEEKLLRAIFGEKASDVRDTSLRVPPGVSGTIVEVRVFSRRGVEKDERVLAIERAEVNKLAQDRDAEKSILERAFFVRLEQLLKGHKVTSAPKGVKAGAQVDTKLLESLTKGQWRQLVIEHEGVMSEIESLKKQHDEDISAIQKWFEDKVDKVRRGDELPTGVLKTVKIFVATKRKIQPGDKMAGRHGNKGVVSYIVPLEDMPHLEDGTPVDIILNPLGLPSRMNVGQILETHLGWASAGLGKQLSNLLCEIYNSAKTPEDLRNLLLSIYPREEDTKKLREMPEEELIMSAGSMIKGIPMATPVFDGAHEEDIVRELEKAGLHTSGQVTLIDGRTGDPFSRKITVGYIYMLKLSHMVDDKIHARSVGPYSLVTQQPLGGKAQFGGQRFGEMEVWALEAYGAAYTLQEMLTVKSDDVSGRTKVYESIVRGDDAFESGIPESFNVLVKELKSLGLNVDLVEGKH